jgi:hypothetical protein
MNLMTFYEAVKFNEQIALAVPKGFWGQLVDSILKIILILNEGCFFLAAVLQRYREKDCIRATLEGSK